MSAATVKSTININKYYKEQLEYFVQTNAINSVTEGINLAIEQFVKEKQKEIYAAEMQKAKADKEFIQRTMGTQKLFEKFDIETDINLNEFSSEEDFEW